MLCNKLMSVVLAGAMTTTMCAPAYAATGTNEAVHSIFSDVRRHCRIYKHEEIIGKDRYETGAMVAKRVGKYSRVILVNGSESMADGLSAASIAGRLGATILPIKSNVIPSSSREIINKAREVYIIGESKAISKGIENSLRSSGKKVVRLGGRDRCETSLKVAKFLGPYNKAYLVNGYTGEADAMSISPISARDGAPVIITNGKTSKLPYNSSTKYVVIGGRAVMTQKLLQKYNGHRIGGDNRYDTNRMVLNTYSKAHNTRYFCNGETLVDALSASFMAKGDGIVLVNRKENHDLLRWVDTVQVGGPKFDIYFPDLHMWYGIRGKKPDKPSGITTEVTNVVNGKGEVHVKFNYSGGDSWEWKGRTDGDMYKPGHHVIKVRNVDKDGNKSDWVEVEFDVEGHGPVIEPVINAVVHRDPNPDRKFKVDINVTNTGGNKVEMDGVSKDGYYSPGKHVIKVRLVDDYGNKSDWYEKEFEITDNAPTQPVVEVVKSRDSYGVKVDFNIVTPSVDLDGDTIEYQWQGKTSNDYYPVGQHTVHVRAVDSTGRMSEWLSVPFTIEDDTKPVFPEVKIEIDRNPTEDRKFKVNFVVDNPNYEVEVQGGTADGLYGKGEHTVKVKVTDSNGNESDWVDKTFEITDGKPTNPEFKVEQTKIDNGAEVKFVEVKASIDPDGDEVQYVWGGDYRDDGLYPPGNYEVTVQAVDSTGLKSDVIKLSFTVSDGKIPSDKLPAIKVEVSKDPNPDGKHKVDITTEEGYDLEIKGGNEDGLYLPGEYQVDVQVTDKDGNKSDWIPTDIFVPGEAKPENKPTINVEVSDTPDENGKYQVDITSPDGDVEIKNGPTDGKFDKGHHEVDVTVTDKDGNEIDTKVEFDVPKGGGDNPNPEPGKTPEINVEVGNTPDGDGKYPVDITSPDGDVTIKGGNEDGKYEPGHHEVDATVTDKDGNETDVKVEFDVPDPDFKPEIKVDVADKPDESGKYPVDITSPEGEVEVKGGTPDSKYPEGHHKVDVQVTKPDGTISEWMLIEFDVPDKKEPDSSFKPEINVEVADKPDESGKYPVDITSPDGKVDIISGLEDGKLPEGHHKVEVQVTKPDGTVSEVIPVEIDVPSKRVPDPNFKPEINVDVADKPDDTGKYPVDITSPDGEVEVKGGTPDGKYPEGHHKVDVQVTKSDGTISDWKPVEFDVPKKAIPDPNFKPEINVEVGTTPDDNGKYPVDITSPDGKVDIISGLEDGKLPEGHHKVEVQVTKPDGTVSEVIPVEIDVPKDNKVPDPNFRPEIKIEIADNPGTDGEYKVDITSPEGEVEVKGGEADGTYPKGHHKVEVQVTKPDGTISNWLPVEFDVPKKGGGVVVVPTINIEVGKEVDAEGKRKVDITSPDGEVEVKNGSDDGKYLPGHHEVEVQVTDKDGNKSDWIPVDFDVPLTPGTIKVDVATDADPDGKRKVTITESNGNTVDVKDGPADGKYVPGHHEVEVQVTDKDGNKSDWIPVEFYIPITADLRVDVAKDPNPDGKHKVDITDNKGRNVEIKDGTPDSMYLPGEHKVKVQVTDDAGLKSGWVDLTFVVPLIPDLEVKIADEYDEAGKRLVTITDKHGHTVTVKDAPADSKYAPGNHDLEVQITNKDGVKSEWVKVSITIPNKPVIPVISVEIEKVPDENGKHKVTITDKNGDQVEVRGGSDDGKYLPGHHEVEVQATDENGNKSEWIPVEFDVPKYVAPDVTVKVDRTPNEERKFKAEIVPVAEGASLEVKDGSAIGYYPAGENTVKAQITDKDGNKSDWFDVKFTITDNKPTNPDFDVVKTNSEAGTNVKLNVTKPSTDADGDSITYVWTKDGLPFNPNPDGDIFEPGSHTVTLKAVDSSKRESEVVSKTFEIGTPPGEPEITITKTREYKGLGPLRKFKVTLDVGDQQVEYRGKSDDDFYAPNKEQVVEVRAKGADGLYSPWKEVKFTVTDTAPTKPELKATRVSEDSFDANIEISKPSTDADGDTVTYEWKGNVDGGKYGPGPHKVEVRALDSTGLTSDWAVVTFEFKDNKPSVPKVETNAAERVAQNGKVKVTITPSGSVSPLGREVEYEFEGKALDDLYTLGEEHTVRVRAKDANGLVSDWVTETFTVNNTAPSKPSFIDSILGEWQEGKQKVKIDLTESVDPEGDAVTYEWEEDGVVKTAISEFFAPGNHTIKVRAKDAFGVVSDWFEKTFTIGEPKPTKPTITISQERVAQGGKAKVDIIVNGSTSPDNAKVEYVTTGITEDGLYDLNTPITVTAKAVAGSYESEVVEKTFTIQNTAPEKPDFSINQEDKEWYNGKQKVMLNPNPGNPTKDADGDTIEYVWEGRQEDNLYAPGTHTVKYKAVDMFGAASEWQTKTFTIGDPVPTDPTVSTNADERVAQNGKVKVIITPSGSVSPVGRVVTYEYEGKAPDDLYELGKEYTIKVHAIDSEGLKSNDVVETFTVTNTAPSLPSFLEKLTGNWQEGKQKVEIDLTESVDPEGDKVTYEWEEDGVLKDKLSEYFTVGTHTIRVRAKDAFGAVSDWFEKTFNIESSNPTDPQVSVSKDRKGKNGKAEVIITPSGSISPSGKEITYEYDSAKAVDDLYTTGETHIVKVRAKDTDGLYSSWVEVKFKVDNTAPTAPSFTLDQSDSKFYGGKQKVTIASGPTSTDADNDVIKYEWKGKAKDNLYAEGEHVLQCRAVDSFGAASSWTSQKFKIVNNGAYLLPGPQFNQAVEADYNSVRHNGKYSFVVNESPERLKYILGGNLYDYRDVSDKQDGSIVRYSLNYDKPCIIATSKSKIYANPDSSEMFSDGAGGNETTSINLTNLDTSQVTNMSSAFSGIDRMTNFTLSGIDTSNVTDMSYMFAYSGFSRVTISGIDTSKVIDMSNMFDGMSFLKTLNIGDLDVSSVKYMNDFINGDVELGSLNVRNWKTTSLENVSGFADNNVQATIHFPIMSYIKNCNNFAGLSNVTLYYKPEFDFIAKKLRDYCYSCKLVQIP